MRLRVLASGLAVMTAMTSLAAESKVAVINMNRLIESHPDTKSNMAVLEQYQQEFEAEQERALAELNRLKDQFEGLRDEALNQALNEKTRDEKKELAQQKLSELSNAESDARRKAMDRRRELNDQKTRMHRRVVDKISEAVKEYANTKKLELVLDSSGMGLNGVETVMYVSDSLDITDDIRKVIEKDKTRKE